jgi:hypothetical protein
MIDFSSSKVVVGDLSGLVAVFRKMGNRRLNTAVPDVKLDYGASGRGQGFLTCNM